MDVQLAMTPVPKGSHYVSCNHAWDGDNQGSSPEGRALALIWWLPCHSLERSNSTSWGLDLSAWWEEGLAPMMAWGRRVWQGALGGLCAQQSPLRTRGVPDASLAVIVVLFSAVVLIWLWALCWRSCWISLRDRDLPVPSYLRANSKAISLPNPLSRRWQKSTFLILLRYYTPVPPGWACPKEAGQLRGSAWSHPGLN